MLVLALTFLVWSNISLVHAEPVEPRGIDIEVPFLAGTREPREPRGPEGRGGGGSGSGPDLRVGPSRNATTVISATTIQAISDAYSTYVTMEGYSYSQSFNTQSIEALAPINVFENESNKEHGLGYLGHHAAANVSGSLSGVNTPESKQYASRLSKITEKDRETIKKRQQEVFREEANFINGTQNQKNLVQVEKQIDDVFRTVLFQGRNPRFANLEELDSSYVYSKAHISMAKRLLNPKSRIHKELGSDKSNEIANDLIEIALSTSHFALGFRNGVEGAIVDTVNGALAISRFTFNGVRNPQQAFNQIMKVWEALNARAFIDTVSYMIDSSFDVLMYGTPYMQGEFLGLLSTNLLMGLLPGHMVPVISRLTPSLRNNNLMSQLIRMNKLTGHLGRGAAGKIFNIYGRVAGSKEAVNLVALAQSLGLKSQAQLESMGLFLNRAIKNQIGSVGDISELIKSYSGYFRNWSPSFIVNDVLSADALNAALAAQGRQISFQAGTAVVRVTARDKVVGLVRVHTQTNKTGRWVTFARELKGKTPQEIKEILNLPEVPTHVSTYNGVAGEQFTISRVGLNDYGSVEGATQLQVTRSNLNAEDFFGTRPIGEIYDGN